MSIAPQSAVQMVLGDVAKERGWDDGTQLMHLITFVQQLVEDTPEVLEELVEYLD